MGSTSRRSRFAEWANSPRVASWFLVVVAVFCGLAAVALYDDAVRLRAKGVRTVGEVLEVRDGRSGFVVMRFRTRDGREVVAEVGHYRWSPEPRVGDRQEIVYDPDHPADNVADVRLGPNYVAPIAFAVGCVLAGAFAWLSFTGRIDWREWAR